jgi:hypothetical protein
MKWHPSSLGKLMTSPRSKSEVLSEGAKTYIKEVAKENFYGYRTDINSKYIFKGRDQEFDSIELLNSVRFTNYQKNTVRMVDEYMTGEADIVTDDLIIDVKTSWSLDTFPALAEDGYESKYEWQLRAYMMLYNKPKAELIYCMVTTSNELLNEWENLSLHRVDHIAPEKRITVLSFERDQDKEKDMIEKLSAATEYYNEYYSLLEAK